MTTTTRQVHVIVPGWGPPHLDEKRSILWSNLRLLDSTRGVGTTLHVTVFCYGKEAVFVDRCVPEHIQVDVVYTPGVCGDFLFRFVTPAFVANDTDVVLIMDDVELDLTTFHL